MKIERLLSLLTQHCQAVAEHVVACLVEFGLETDRARGMQLPQAGAKDRADRSALSNVSKNSVYKIVYSPENITNTLFAPCSVEGMWFICGFSNTSGVFGIALLPRAGGATSPSLAVNLLLSRVIAGLRKAQAASRHVAN